MPKLHTHTDIHAYAHTYKHYYYYHHHGRHMNMFANSLNKKSPIPPFLLLEHTSHPPQTFSHNPTCVFCWMCSTHNQLVHSTATEQPSHNNTIIQVCGWMVEESSEWSHECYNNITHMLSLSNKAQPANNIKKHTHRRTDRQTNRRKNGHIWQKKMKKKNGQRHANRPPSLRRCQQAI